MAGAAADQNLTLPAEAEWNWNRSRSAPLDLMEVFDEIAVQEAMEPRGPVRGVARIPDWLTPARQRLMAQIAVVLMISDATARDRVRQPLVIFATVPPRKPHAPRALRAARARAR